MESDHPARWRESLVAHLSLTGVRTIIDVGTGAGALLPAIQRAAGVARAVNVELTPTYEMAAGELLREVGLADRVEDSST